ncbi:lyase family protein [Nostocoides sp. HKS02]|uniref:lyase family protein n=1 Tax=Nostocoides sp. HKS02 TaxID=1813880 RepID=UPI0012B47DDF|nr:lyase family protein [Tetrasphaera sp. HKS02]QGN57441.1 adenylosuccinate lyase [Tetrasphaera sp. HKS02]
MSPANGLLEPGSGRASGVADDAALLAAMVRVEVGWLRALASVGAINPDDAEMAAAAVSSLDVDLVRLRADTEAAGNPVVPLVQLLRDSVREPRVSTLIHRGLTSQDVLDTALVLLARDALTRIREDLAAAARALGQLAQTHRGTVMAGRTLTQYAVPITFGLKASQWLSGVLDALEQVEDVLDRLPVQCGGAGGTLSLVAEVAGDPVAVARAFADELALVWPGLPWHTTRTPVTRLGDALVGACDAVGVVATDVALLSRPEIAEVREGAVAGRGGSSTMPHKRNPVLSVLVRSAALQAPLLGAQLHLAAGQAVDERPDGAWHSEWPALRRLLELTVTATSQAAELASGLEVDAVVMQARVVAAADSLLAERGGGGTPQDYLGATGQFVDHVLARLPKDGPRHG